MDNDLRIALFEGDGIGPEVTAPALRILDAALARCGTVRLAVQPLPAGAGCFLATGRDLPSASVDAARAADATLLAAMGLPHVRWPDGREITPQITLRMELELYAGVRPVKPVRGVARTLADPRAAEMDFVIVRESTEGLFAPQAPGSRTADEARETLVITRRITEKLVDFSCHLAARRKAEGRGPGRVTCVDKANVFAAFWFMREIFEARARAFPELTADAIYVDAFAMHMAQKPWTIDVALTENMFGDILSDLGAALMGGLGYAPSADIGDDCAVFQPCHGTAPDIAGQGRANPTAMILSGVMMLDWLAERRGAPEAARAASLIRRAVDAAFAEGRLMTCELGGSAGVAEVEAAVTAAMAGLAA